MLSLEHRLGLHEAAKRHFTAIAAEASRTQPGDLPGLRMAAQTESHSMI